MTQVFPFGDGGVTVYVTLSLAVPGATALVADFAHLRRAVARAQARRPFQVDAWTVLPDHLHALCILPPGDVDAGARCRAIMADFARHVTSAALTPEQQLAGRDHLWHPAPDLIEVAGAEARDRWRRHCWADPVRHGYVTAPHDWAHSSCPRAGAAPDARPRHAPLPA